MDKLLDNKRTVNLSYRTRYYKLKDAYDKLLEQQSKLEDYIKASRTIYLNAINTLIGGHNRGQKV